METKTTGIDVQDVCALTPLRDILISGEYTISGLARSVGVTRQWLSAVLNGRRPLTFRLARDISRETGIALGDIYEVAK